MTQQMQYSKTQQPTRQGGIKQLLGEYSAFTNGGVRSWLFYDTDGFRSECTFKIGSKIMFDYNAIDEWLEAHRGGVKAECGAGNYNE